MKLTQVLSLLLAFLGLVSCASPPKRICRERWQSGLDLPVCKGWGKGPITRWGE